METTDIDLFKRVFFQETEKLMDRYLKAFHANDLQRIFSVTSEKSFQMWCKKNGESFPDLCRRVKSEIHHFIDQAITDWWQQKQAATSNSNRES